MNTLIFVGRVASAPVQTRPQGESITKFPLITNESRGTDQETGEKREERKVDIQFTSFGRQAEIIAENVMEGDQLIVTARLENSRYTDKEGVERFGYNFILQTFEFGAPGKRKRAQLEQQQQQQQRNQG